MKKTFISIFPVIAILVLIFSCKDDEPETDVDQALYDEINSDLFMFYQEGATLERASASPHGSFKLRFNQTAFDALNEEGELPEGGSFPEGSVLVKEIYNGNALSLYAVMKKQPSHADAGNGWLWAEYNTDGSSAYSVSNKGGSCVSCHSESPNRDLVRTFDFH